MFERSLSLLIFSQISLRINNQSTMQSTTRDTSTNSQIFSLARKAINLLRSSRFLLSIIQTVKSSSALSSSLHWLRSVRMSFNSASARVMVVRIMTQSFLIYISFLAESRMAVNSFSMLWRRKQARARASVCSQEIRLTARESISTHFWWFFTIWSFLKFQRKGLFAEQVVRRSLVLEREGLFTSMEGWLLREEIWTVLALELLEAVVSVRVKERFMLLLGVRSRTRPCLRSCPFLTSQEKTSDQSARSLGFFMIILRRILTTSLETLGYSGILRSSSSMIIISLPMLLLSKGQKPQSMRNSTTPSDQMSDLIEQFSPLRIQGAMQMGDPSMVFEIQSSFSRGLQKPKSANLMRPSWSNKFSGLRSRCMMLCLLSTRKAATICAKYARAMRSGSPPLSFLIQFSFSFRSFSRVPPLQYSQTKQQLLTVLSMSKYLMMWGQASRLVRMLIQLQVPSSSFGY